MPAFTTLRIVTLLGGIMATSGAAAAQTEQDRTQDRVAFPAHKIIGNLYYVGTGTLNSYLITTPQGHILINTNFEETVPLLRGGGREARLQDDRHQDHPRQPRPRRSHAGRRHRQGDDRRRDGDGDGAGRAGAQGDEGAERQAASDRPRPQGRRAGDARRHHADGPPDARPHARLHDLDDDESRTAAGPTTC